MCGIAGAFKIGSAPITFSSIEKIAEGIEKRGRHAWGMSWIDFNNRIHTFKAPGRITDSIHLLDEVSTFDPTAIILHTRHQTHGSAAMNMNNHPHHSDGGWYVHNGQIRNWQSLIAEHRLLPLTDCDSEVLGLIAQYRDGSLLRRWRYTINQCELTNPLCVAGLWSRPNRAILARRGNPLMFSLGSTGNYYFSSVKDGLPTNEKSRPKEVRDNTIQFFDLNTGSKSVDTLIPFAETGVKFAGSGSTMAVTIEDDEDEDELEVGVGDLMRVNMPCRSSLVGSKNVLFGGLGKAKKIVR